MSKLQELLQQQEALSKQIQTMRGTERAEAISKVRALMSEYGLTPQDVVGTRKGADKGGSGSKRSVAAKYRDPATGDTWSGRGLMPRWLKAKVNEGAPAESFAVGA